MAAPRSQSVVTYTPPAPQPWGPYNTAESIVVATGRRQAAAAWNEDVLRCLKGPPFHDPPFVNDPLSKRKLKESYRILLDAIRSPEVTPLPSLIRHFSTLFALSSPHSRRYFSVLIAGLITLRAHPSACSSFQPRARFEQLSALLADTRFNSFSEDAVAKSGRLRELIVDVVESGVAADNPSVADSPSTDDVLPSFLQRVFARRPGWDTIVYLTLGDVLLAGLLNLATRQRTELSEYWSDEYKQSVFRYISPFLGHDAGPDAVVPVDDGFKQGLIAFCSHVNSLSANTIAAATAFLNNCSLFCLRLAVYTCPNVAWEKLYPTLISTSTEVQALVSARLTFLGDAEQLKSIPLDVVRHLTASLSPETPLHANASALLREVARVTSGHATAIAGGGSEPDTYHIQSSRSFQEEQQVITHSITPYLEAVLAQRSIPVGHPSVASARPSAILDRVRRGLGDACWDDFNLVASALASYHAEAHAEMGRSIRCPVLLRDSHALCGRWLTSDDAGSTPVAFSACGHVVCSTCALDAPSCPLCAMPSAAVPVPGFGDFAAIARATELESPKDPLGASSPTPSVACPLHAHTTARFFCVTCSVACCGTCVVTSHADDAHDTLPTADACEHFLGALSTLSTSMRAGHVAISSLLPSFHHLASHCSPRALPSFSSLRTGVDDVIASLGRARDRFVGDARARCAAAQKLLIAQQEELGSSEAALTACAGMCTSQRTLPVRPQALLSSALAVAGLIQGTEPLLQQSVLITDSSYFFRDFDAIAAGICRIMSEFDVAHCAATGEGLHRISVAGDGNRVGDGAPHTLGGPPVVTPNNILIHCKDEMGRPIECITPEDVSVRVECLEEDGVTPIRRALFQAPVVGATEFPGELTVTCLALSSSIHSARVHISVCGFPFSSSPWTVKPDNGIKGELVGDLLVNETMGNVGLAVNASGTLLAALNLSRSYIAVYTLPDGKLKCTFGSKGSKYEQLSFPRKLCFAPSTGNLLIADSGNQRVQEVTTEGRFVKMFGVGVIDSEIHGVAASDALVAVSKGVANTADGHISLFDYNTCEILRRFSGAGVLQKHRLLYYAGLRFTPDGSAIIIADRGNKQLSCYDTNGNRLWVSVDEERLKGHTDIDFDTRGDIIVCDYTNQQLHVYAWRNGEEAGGGGRGSVPRYSRSFSSKGFGPGRVMFPSAIASARGQLWVLDEYTARVQRFE